MLRLLLPLAGLAALLRAAVSPLASPSPKGPRSAAAWCFVAGWGETTTHSPPAGAEKREKPVG